MDPNSNLKEQLRIAAIIESGEAGVREWGAAAHRLAELVEALDQWIRRGGFLPAVWADEKTKRELRVGTDEDGDVVFSTDLPKGVR